MIVTDIRNMRPGDLAAVVELNKLANEFPWRDTTVKKCFDVGYVCKLLWRGDEIIAFAIYHIHSGECHLYNLTVSHQHQRKGYASEMLQYLIEDAVAKKCQKILLEVRASNTSAILLYAKFKFKRIAHRKDYYPRGDGREDAFIYHLNI